MCLDDVAAHRQPQAGAALAAGVRAVLCRVERLEYPRQLVGRNTAAVVADHHVDHVVLGVVKQLDPKPPAAGHRLPGVDQKVQQHLLYLVAVGHRRRNLLIALLDYYPVLVHLPFQQHQRVVHQFYQIGRLQAGGAVPRHSQDGVGDRRRTIGRGVNLTEALVAGLGVFVAHPHLRVVENGHQHVVELVGGGAYQFAQRGQPLCLSKPMLENVDLLLEVLLIPDAIGSHDLIPPPC